MNPQQILNHWTTYSYEGLELIAWCKITCFIFAICHGSSKTCIFGLSNFCVCPAFSSTNCISVTWPPFKSVYISETTESLWAKKTHLQQRLPFLLMPLIWPYTVSGMYTWQTEKKLQSLDPAPTTKYVACKFLNNQKTCSTQGVQNDASAWLTNPSSTSCDLDLWPLTPKLIISCPSPENYLCQLTPK